MCEAKFTKGGWSFDPELEIDDRMVVVDDNYNPILYLETELVFDGDGYINQLSDEQDANAHLIAAAPEMYAMLDKLSPMFTEINAHALSNEIEKLLAKARGEYA